MGKKTKILISLPILCLIALFSAAALAQQSDKPSATPLPAEAQEAIIDSDNLDNETQDLEGVDLVKPNGIPTPFGLFWNNLKENIFSLNKNILITIQKM